MSVNKFKPHIYVIPEDRRNEQIANGFAQHPSVMTRQMQVVEPACGWEKTLDTLRDEYVALLRQHHNAYVVLVIDFDGSCEKRRKFCDSEIPEDVRDRVFVVGSQIDPETLKRSLDKNYEDIGRSLADDCDGDKLDFWGHEQLMHNESDRLRLVQVVKPFLFS
jgi:hypothetical protein